MKKARTSQTNILLEKADIELVTSLYFHIVLEKEMNPPEGLNVD